MKKIMCVFGTRPEAIKMSPVIKELQKYPKRVQLIICVTAQHREMLDEVMRIFKIKPDYDLAIMENNQSPFEVTVKGLLGLRNILEKERPRAVVVQGDTTTAFAVALACFYLKIPVCHVEAGLRTKDKYNPFPEEINRRLISNLADLHFAPTQQAENNLLREGVEKKNIFLTGNTVIDALQWVSKENKKMQKRMDFLFPFLKSTDRLILVTAHRRESFGLALSNICRAVKKIVERNPEVQIVFPVHPNPNVKKTVTEILGKVRRVHLISPLDYASFVHFMNKSYFILTDSGGIQEEAPFLGKPVLVMREKTERMESVKAGASFLAGTGINLIVNSSERLLSDKQQYQKMSKKLNLYGDGKASRRIARILLANTKL